MIAPIAVLAFLVGVVSWGLLFGWTFATVRDALDGDNGQGGDDVVIEPISDVDCDDIGEDRTPTLDESTASLKECVLPTPVSPIATSTPVPPTATPTLAPTDENRFNCNLIRGTNYRSPAERTWFLDNCLTPTPS